MELGMVGLGRMGANMTERLLRAGHLALVVDDRPVQAFLAWEVTEDDGLVDPGTLRDLPRGGAFEALAGEQLLRHLNDLLAAVHRRNAHWYRSGHCK